VEILAPEATLDLASAMFAVTCDGAGGQQAAAMFAPDDDVWFWTFGATSDEWSDVAGAFRCTPNDAERRALIDLAARLDAGRVPPSEIDADIETAVAALLTTDRLLPVTAIRLRAGRMTGADGQTVLGASLSSIGTEQAVVHLGEADGGVRLVRPDGSQRALPRGALVDAEDQLLDGWQVPATIGPGGVAMLVLRGVDAGPGDVVRLAGSIRAGGPWPPQAAASVAFEVASRLE